MLHIAPPPPAPYEIKEHRANLGLTQEKFAMVLGVSRRAVEEWEAGRNPAPPMLTYALRWLANPTED
jgi:DNA-binding transcriptional regulator YiaG